jgi:DNA (cytosine-5)-methyltransferase 1
MRLRTLDLFSGCGGSSAGARKAGAKIVAAVDAWGLATDVYKENFPGTKVVTKRLDKIPIKVFHNSIGEIDLLLASPECTNHTLAKGNARRSEESRETAFQVLRFAQEFKPRWVVVENVIQMRRWRRYKSFMASMKAMGYKAREQVLNAKNFGAAQDRKRLFILWAREKTPLKVQSTLSGRPKIVRQILDRPGEWKSSQLLADNRADSTIARYCNGLNKLGEKKSFLLVYYGSDAGGGWQHLDRPLRTITTVDRFALITPNSGNPRMRMLQVSELKRAMGFAAKYRLNSGTRRDQIKLLGNAVCPPVMAAVVRTLVRGEKRRRKTHRQSR